jgi:hypothetical protein
VAAAAVMFLLHTQAAAAAHNFRKELVGRLHTHTQVQLAAGEMGRRTQAQPRKLTLERTLNVSHIVAAVDMGVVIALPPQTARQELPSVFAAQLGSNAPSVHRSSSARPFSTR